MGNQSILVKNYQLPNVICVAEVELYQRGEPIYSQIITSNSYTMGCPHVRGDNPRVLASGLSYVRVDKNGITVLSQGGGYSHFFCIRRLGPNICPSPQNNIRNFKHPKKIFEILATQKISPILYLDLKKRP